MDSLLNGCLFIFMRRFLSPAGKYIIRMMMVVIMAMMIPVTMGPVFMMMAMTRMYTGRLCVIGCDLAQEKLAELFELS